MWWIKWWEKTLYGNNEKCKMLEVDIRSMFLKKKKWN
jgi:hypothetical protein